MLGNPKSSAKSLSDASIPIFAIRWNRETRQRTGGDPIRHFLWRWRDSLMSPDSYANIKKRIFGDALNLTGPSPLIWEQWSSALGQYGMGDMARMNKWRETVANFATSAPLSLWIWIIWILHRLFISLVAQISVRKLNNCGNPRPCLYRTDARAAAKFTGPSEEDGDLLLLAKWDYLQTNI